jgi:cobalamin synthase
MLHIAGGIILALLGLLIIAAFAPFVLIPLGWFVMAIVYIIAAPFMFYQWIKRKLNGKL